MNRVVRTMALIALAGALVGVAAAQASVNSAAKGKRLGARPTCTASPESASVSNQRPLVHPGGVLIESEPGVYIAAPCLPERTKSPATVSPASIEPAAASNQRPLVRPGEVLIENEPGVYIVALPAG